MTDWADIVARATALRDRVEQHPDAVDSAIDELLELAHDDAWLVQRTS